MAEVQKTQERFSAWDVMYAGNAGAIASIFQFKATLKKTQFFARDVVHSHPDRHNSKVITFNFSIITMNYLHRN